MATIVPAELGANWLGALGVAVITVQRGGIAAAGGDSRAAALLTLREFPGIPVGELAAVLGLSHSACVRVVDALVAEGLTARTRTSHDARRAELVLTAAGRRAADRLQAMRLRALESLLDALSEAERTEFGRLVEKLLTGLTTDRAIARQTCRYCAHRICSGPDCPIGRSVRVDGERSSRC